MHIITMTKQATNGSLGPAPQGAGAPEISEKSDSLALSFSGPQDAINFARAGIQDANRRAACDAVELVKSYKEAKLDIVLNVTAGSDPSSYDLVFSAVVNWGRKSKSTLHSQVFDLHPAAIDTDGDQQSVLVGVTELVECPEGIIPSLMRIERSKQRSDFRRQIFASPFGVNIQFTGAVGEGEVGIFRLRDPSENGCGITTLIECGPQRFNRLDGGIGPTIGDFARKLEAMDRVPIRVHLTDRSSWFIFEKSLNTFFQPTDMLLCAC